MQKQKPILLLSAIFILCQLLISSCGSVRKSEYFADQGDALIRSSNVAPQSLLQPNDIISITVSSLNPNATLIFNTPNIANATATTSTGGYLQAPGYLINQAGNIEFPVLGELKVSGMTTDQVRLAITKQLIDKKLLVDPTIVVRQLNFRVSVLGEVSHPTVITVPSEKISLLEALGLAGDITIFGRKDRVMVIREENGQKRVKRLDLNSTELFNSPYYYLQSNDIVYVEANKAKVNNSSQGTLLIPIILSGLSIIAVVVDAIVRR